ncbi:N-acetyl-gamma-glutamyl-phosphate reductase [Streptococcus rifensis]
MKVAIIGVTGYSGIELYRLLRQHSHIEVHSVHASQSVGHGLSDLLPHMGNDQKLTIEAVDPEQIMKTVDLVFIATPSGYSKDIAGRFLEQDFPVVDLSGDYRLPAAVYEKWYGKSAAPASEQEQFTYGLSEWTTLFGKKFISNPGCYATATLLSLLPLVDIIDEKSIIVDAKSGLTGAGKSLTASSHFVQAYGNYSTYKLNRHQHIPEIMRVLQAHNPEIPHLQFSTSLLPVNRGIVATSYLHLKDGKTAEDVDLAFKEAYKESAFIQLQGNQFPDLHQVVGSNRVAIGWEYNSRTEVLTVITVLDNLIKGAAGQAIQNVNLMYGFPETAGLDNLATYI